MKLLNVINALIPPLLLVLLLMSIRGFSGFSGKYDSWNKALQKCKGYEHSTIVETYSRNLKSELENPTISSTKISGRKIRALAAFGLAQSTGGDPVSEVIDFGGGWGADYFELAPNLPQLKSWVVVESKEVAQNLSKVSGLPALLSFSERIPISSGSQIIFASGAIQCLEEGLGLLDSFADSSKFVVLDRVPITQKEKSWVSIQRTSRLLGGVGSSYPVWFFAAKDFEAAIEGKWKIVLRWEVPEDAPFVSRGRLAYSGFLLQKI